MPAEEQLSAQQRSKVRRLSEPRELAPDEEGGELNIVPFLDIIMNVLMFVLATVSVTFITTIDVPPPRQSSRNIQRQDNQEQLQLTLLLLEDQPGKPGGIVVNGRDHTFAPGCTEFGPTGKPIIPWKGDPVAHPFAGTDRKWLEYQFDETALRDCMKELKKHWETEKSVTVTTSNSMAYTTLIRVIDSIRQAPDLCINAGKPSTCAEGVLFPEVTFALLSNK